MHRWRCFLWKRNYAPFTLATIVVREEPLSFPLPLALFISESKYHRCACVCMYVFVCQDDIYDQCKTIALRRRAEVAKLSTAPGEKTLTCLPTQKYTSRNEWERRRKWQSTPGITLRFLSLSRNSTVDSFSVLLVALEQTEYRRDFSSLSLLLL